MSDQSQVILECVMNGLVKSEEGADGLERRILTPSEIDLGQRLLELAFQLGIKVRYWHT